MELSSEQHRHLERTLYSLFQVYQQNLRRMSSQPGTCTCVTRHFWQNCDIHFSDFIKSHIAGYACSWTRGADFPRDCPTCARDAASQASSMARDARISQAGSIGFVLSPAPGTATTTQPIPSGSSQGTKRHASSSGSSSPSSQSGRNQPKKKQQSEVSSRPISMFGALRKGALTPPPFADRHTQNLSGSQRSANQRAADTRRTMGQREQDKWEQVRDEYGRTRWVRRDSLHDDDHRKRK